MWRGNAWKRHDAIETVSINQTIQTHMLFAPCLLHPFTVKVFPVLWASLFTCCGRCRYEVCHFSISSRATCGCRSVCRGIAVATQRATAMVGGRFVGFPEAETKNKLVNLTVQLCFSRCLTFCFCNGTDCRTDYWTCTALGLGFSRSYLCATTVHGLQRIGNGDLFVFCNAAWLDWFDWLDPFYWFSTSCDSPENATQHIYTSSLLLVRPPGTGFLESSQCSDIIFGLCLSCTHGEFAQSPLALEALWKCLFELVLSVWPWKSTNCSVGRMGKLERVMGTVIPERERESKVEHTCALTWYKFVGLLPVDFHTSENPPSPKLTLEH